MLAKAFPFSLQYSFSLSDLLVLSSTQACASSRLVQSKRGKLDATRSDLSEKALHSSGKKFVDRFGHATWSSKDSDECHF